MMQTIKNNPPLARGLQELIGATQRAPITDTAESLAGHFGISQLPGEAAEAMRFELKRVIRHQRAGYGYFTSSREPNSEVERFVSAAVAQAMRDGAMRVTPIEMSIGQFYGLYPSTISWVRKMELVAKEQTSIPGLKYGVVLSGFSSDPVLTKDVIENIPFQPVWEECLSTSTATLASYHTFQNIVARHIEQSGGLEQALDIMSCKAGFVDRTDLRILGTLIAMVLIESDIQLWQTQWTQPPLVVVAPAYVHDAINRFTFFCGHGPTDYGSRAAQSIGRNEEPWIDREGGTLVFPDPTIQKKQYREQGPPVKDVVAMLAVLARFVKAFDSN